MDGAVFVFGSIMLATFAYIVFIKGRKPKAKPARKSPRAKGRF